MPFFHFEQCLFCAPKPLPGHSLGMGVNLLFLIHLPPKRKTCVGARVRSHLSFCLRREMECPLQSLQWSRKDAGNLDDCLPHSVRERQFYYFSQIAGRDPQTCWSLRVGQIHSEMVNCLGYPGSLCRELEGAAGVYLDSEMLFKIRLCF